MYPQKGNLHEDSHTNKHIGNVAIVNVATEHDDISVANIYILVIDEGLC